MKFLNEVTTMKKTLSLIFALALLISLLAACGAQGPATTTAPETTAAPTEPVPAGPSQAAIEALDGKKILFIGNSYTYWGRVVEHGRTDELTQANRNNDKGLFYHLCKQNGIDVSVTNWVFAGHDLTDMTTNEACLTKETNCFGVNHGAYLTDRNFDYVAIQCFFESEYEGDLVAHLQPTLDMFREANPNVKFLFLVPHMAYVRNFHWSVSELSKLPAEGITVCNWGGMLNDLVNKVTSVPGGTQQYFLGSFVISKTEDDGHHQNLLAGYLTALMTYCAITGDSAVGQPYAFADDPSVHPDFNMEQFQATNYVYNPITNFVDIYRSEADMKGLQQLVDLYLEKYNIAG